jgi:hypothetical protein
MSSFTWGAAVFLAVAMASFRPASAAAPLAVDATGCLETIKSAPAKECPLKSSLSIELVNTCAFPVRTQICIRGPNHLYAVCEVRKSVSPMEHVAKATCDTDGTYTFWGCSQFSAASGNCGGDDLIGKSTNLPK